MKQIIYSFIAFSLLTMVSCSKETPVACLTSANLTTGKVGVSLTFESCSTGAHHEEWDFGDTTTGTGTKVAHSYSKAGSYTVKLTAYNSDKSLSDTKTSTVTISQ